MYIIRFADDTVIGFQKEKDAHAFREALAKRLAKFGLELHPEKTKASKFGKLAREDNQKKGQKPQSFDFLGFTHISGVDRRGRFQLKRRTASKRKASETSEPGERTANPATRSSG